MHNRQRKLSMWVLLSLCEKKRNHDVTIVYLTYSKINEQYSVTFHDPRVTTGLLLRKQAWSIKKYIIWHNDRYFLAEKTAKPPSRAKKLYHARRVDNHSANFVRIFRLRSETYEVANLPYLLQYEKWLQTFTSWIKNNFSMQYPIDAIRLR